MATPLWVATTTWATGDVPAASDANAYWTTNLDHLASPAGVQVVRSTALSISNSVASPFTPITWSTPANWDTDTFLSGSRLTVPTGLGGRYFVSMWCEWAANTTGQRIIALLKNGALVFQAANQTDPGNYGVDMGHADEIALAAGDYVEMSVYQNVTPSASLNINKARMTIRKVSN